METLRLDFNLDERGGWPEEAVSVSTERLRSPIQWYGGKGHMLAKLLPLVPEGGKPYCEPYMGGASLFFARDPAPVEVLNDLDGELVNLFRCLQDKETFEELRHRIMWTPYSRAEFARAIEILKNGTEDAVERAWAYFVAKNQGVSSKSKSAGDWSRVFIVSGGMATTTNRWIMRQSMLDAWRWRLMRVQIDNRDALEVIKYWDTPDTVFYIDPPYHQDTRKEKKSYRVEADNDHHAALVDVLLRVSGSVTLSGYCHEVYAPLEESGWQRIDFKTSCYAAVKNRNSGLQGHGATTEKVPRVESVWLNPAALQRVR